MTSRLVGREGAELMERFAGVIERDGGERAEAADVVGVEVGEDDGGEAVGGQRVRGESEGQEAAVEPGGEAAGVSEVRAGAGVEQEQAGARMAEGRDEGG